MVISEKEKRIPNRLTSHEKETIIVFNETNELAHVFTYNKAWQKHMEQTLGLKPTRNNGYGGKEYDIDKSRIKMPRQKRAGRVMDEKEKAAARGYLAKGRASRKARQTQMPSLPLETL